MIRINDRARESATGEFTPKLVVGLIWIVLLVMFLAVPLTMASAANVDTYINNQKQRETSIAVNPNRPDNIVIGFNDYTTGVSRPGYTYSIDGGATWVYGGSLRQGGLTHRPSCDPWLAFDRQGYLYYVALSASTDHKEIFVCVARPDVSGNVGPLGFGDPQIVDDGFSDNDKPALAVDATGGTFDGNIYVVWSHKAGAGLYKIWFRRGTRTGPTTITWTEASFQVSPTAVLYTQGAQVAVGPNGEVYVAHARMTTSSITNEDAILFSRSLGGGAPGTWTTGIHVSTVDAVDWEIDNTDRGARHASFPTLGVSSQTGTIFIAWADERNGDDDVLLTKSVDEGNTWLTVPKRVNTDTVGSGKDQLHPALTVTPSGVVDVIFYDRRDDPANTLFNLYLARSWDEGDSWTNSVVTSQPTDPDVFASPGAIRVGLGLGDYVGIASASISPVTDRTYMAWTDGRVGQTSPRDLNTDIFFDSRNSTQLFIFPIYELFLELRFIPSCVPPTRCPIEIPVRLLSLHDFKDVVTLRAEGVPEGAFYHFTNSSGVPPFETELVIVSEYAEDGLYEIVVYAESGNMTQSQSITVAITSTPYLLLEATRADPGDLVRLEGHGFTAKASFDVFFDGKPLQTDTVDENGIISTDIRIPHDAPDGIHSVSVKDGEDVEASTTLDTPILEEEGVEKPDIESCDLAGVRQDIFEWNETVYVTGKGFAPNSTYEIFVVNDTIYWSDNMLIPLRIPGTTTTIHSNSSGGIPPTVVWNHPMSIGKYDIIVDVGGDGSYDDEIDALDDNDVEITAGFLIPEFPLTLISALLLLLALTVATATTMKTQRKATP